MSRCFLSNYSLFRRFFSSSSRRFGEISTEIDAGFNDEKTDKLLKHLNTMTPEDFAKTNLLTLSKAISFCRWRNQMGGFHNVSDIMKITGVGHVLAGQLCQQLLSDDTEKEDENVGKPAQSSLSGCIPRLSASRAQSIVSFAALDIGQNHVTWCSMFRESSNPESPIHVNDWNRTQFLETPFVATKHSHATLHERMVDVAYRHLPVSVDCFVTEFKRPRCPSLKFMPLVVNQTVAETVLLTLLNVESYNERSAIHKVFKMRPSVVTRLFGLSVGNERVSGHRVVEAALNRRPLNINEVETEESVRENFFVDINATAMSRYKSIGDMEKESFNVAFLLGVAFYEVVLKSTAQVAQSLPTGE